ncbi:hypothetical protein F4825DRAFT_16208 [Nemania diffusa]|nr:hypothetical protein F4825DRAFT_16208 [Nemania diffusa]
MVWHSCDYLSAQISLLLKLYFTKGEVGLWVHIIFIASTIIMASNLALRQAEQQRNYSGMSLALVFGLLKLTSPASISTPLVLTLCMPNYSVR